MKQPRMIRKYVNRRLYDTTQSRYVNLGELHGIIIGGEDIQVTEQATQNDITTTVLLQILEESQRTDSHLLKPDFLANIIRLSHGNVDPDLPERLNSVVRGAVITGSTLQKTESSEKQVAELS
jgi:polyhydroxyalkanoate synthesis repressor PhaR